MKNLIINYLLIYSLSVFGHEKMPYPFSVKEKLHDRNEQLVLSRIEMNLEKLVCESLDEAIWDVVQKSRRGLRHNLNRTTDQNKKRVIQKIINIYNGLRIPMCAICSFKKECKNENTRS